MFLRRLYLNIYFLATIFFIEVFLAQIISAAELAESASRNPTFTKIQNLDAHALAESSPVQNKWAVVIGISKFSDRRLSQPGDEYRQKAASKFYDYLVDPKYGHFEPNHVRLLTDDKASQQSINNTLGESWLTKLAGPEDLVVIFINTRSFPTTDGNSYLCSYNCAFDNIYGTCFSLHDLMQNLKKSIKSKRVVLILESNLSGEASLASGAKSLAPGYNLDLEKTILGTGYIILASSQPGQLSWNDNFSSNLINALKEKDGQISLSSAFQKARDATEYDSLFRMHAAKKQTPVIKSEWKGNDIVIGCLPIQNTTNIPDSVKDFIGAETHYLAANRAVIASDFRKAKDEYEAAIAKDPNLTDAISDYAVLLTMEGNWSAAEIKLRKALEKKTNDSLYLINYARVLDKLGRTSESKQYLEKALVINPKDKVALTALSDKYLHSGNIEEALKLMEQAILIYPEQAKLHDKMCFILSMQDRNNEALKAARKALELEPNMVSAHLKVSALLSKKGEYKEALSEVQIVLSQEPDNSDAHYLAAKFYEELAQKENAFSEFKKFLLNAKKDDPRIEEVQKKLNQSESI